MRNSDVLAIIILNICVRNSAISRENKLNVYLCENLLQRRHKDATPFAATEHENNHQDLGDEDDFGSKDDFEEENNFGDEDDFGNGDDFEEKDDLGDGDDENDVPDD